MSSYRYQRVWIVQMLHEGYARWHSTVGCKLTKEDALKEMRAWKKRNPNDRFRVMEYLPVLN